MSKWNPVTGGDLRGQCWDWLCFSFVGDMDSRIKSTLIGDNDSGLCGVADTLEGRDAT